MMGNLNCYDEEGARFIGRDISSLDIREIVEEINKLNKLRRQRTKIEREYYNRLYKAYKKLRSEWEIEEAKKYNEKIKEATGLDVGDVVEYVAVAPFGICETFKGKIVIYRRMIKVKLDKSYNGKRYFPLNRGWVKIGQ